MSTTKGMKLVKLARSFKRRNRSNSSLNIVLLSVAGGQDSSRWIHDIFNPLCGETGHETKEITETVATFPQEDVQTQGQGNKVRLLRCPDLGDPSAGCGDDGQTLANVAQFYRRKGYCPDCVLFTAHYDDEKLSGTTFFRLLQSIKTQLRHYVIDPLWPNVVMVLLRNKNDPPIEAPKMDCIKKIVQDNLEISKCTVMGIEAGSENKSCCDDEPNLLRIFSSRLSDAAKAVPVEERMSHVSLLNVALTKLSSPSMDLTSKSHVIQEVVVPMTNRRTIMAAPTDNESTPLATILSQGWTELTPRKRKDSRMKPEELTQKLDRLGFKTLADLPRTVRDTMILFRRLRPDPPMEVMLRKVGLEGPRFPVDFLLGSGYNITTDRQATFNVIDLGQYTLSDVGCSLPNNVIAHEHPEVRYICKIAQNMQELQKERLIELGFSVELPLLGGFKYGYRNGYNILSGSTMQKLTSVYEKRVLMLECKPSAPLTKELRKAVEELPTTYNRADAGNVQRWVTLFNRFGTHYISRAYVGGAITFDIVTSNSKECTSSFSEHDSGLSGIINTIVASTTLAPRSSDIADSTTKGNKLNCNAAGGDSSVVTDLWTSRTEEEFLGTLKAWEETIWENPIVSDMSITLGEITDLLVDIRADVVAAMRLARCDLYAGQLKVNVEPQPELEKGEEAREADSKSNRKLSKKQSFGCHIH